jgi:hypothetical protein
MLLKKLNFPHKNKKYLLFLYVELGELNKQ